MDWLARHWKTLATVALSTGIFLAVTALTGGLGAPLLVALAAGGFSSGVAGYAMAQLLEGASLSVKDALIAGAVSTAVTVGTLGIGRLAAPALSRAVAPVASALPAALANAIPEAVKTAIANTTVGASLGTTIQVAGNAIKGRPLGEGAKEAALAGGVGGLLVQPGVRIVSALAPAPPAPAGPSKTHGLAGMLGESGETAPAPKPVAKPTVPEAPAAKAPEPEPPTGRTNEAFEAWKKGVPRPEGVDPVADVAYFAKDAPALEGDLAALRAKGWRIVYGEPGKGSWCNAEKVPPEIVVDPQGEPVEILKTLAHEVGHAHEPPTPFRDPRVLSRDDYVATRLHDMALSEGQAVLNEVTTLQGFRRAVLGRTGESPQLPYQGAYRTIAENRSLSLAQKIERIGSRYMREESPSAANGESYEDYWSRLFGQEWDEAHAAQ